MISVLFAHKSPCLPPQVLQPRAKGCVCRGVQAMCHCPNASATSDGGTCCFTPCMGWKGKRIWGGRWSIPVVGATARLWVTPAWSDQSLPVPSSQFRLSSVYSSLCAVNQELRWLLCFLSLGVIPLLVELTLCARVFPVISQLGEPPIEALGSCW